MYVCICNALREKQLSEAADGDVRTVIEVFRRCGARPQCGKCLPDVAEVIERNRMAESKGTALAAE